MYDFKRGLWYGLFSPTPILPMSWWWEFFDGNGLTPYFRGVREMSDRMLEAGGGSFERVEVRAEVIESYGIRCGQTTFVYLLNNSSRKRTSDLVVSSVGRGSFSVLSFDPSTRAYRRMSLARGGKGALTIPKVTIEPKHDLIFTITPAGG